jgi:hypothetical protein
LGRERLPTNGSPLAGAFWQDATLVALRTSKAIGAGAAPYFVCSLSRPNR